VRKRKEYVVCCFERGEEKWLISKRRKKSGKQKPSENVTSLAIRREFTLFFLFFFLRVL